MAATHALGKIPGEAVGSFLISKWRVLTGPVRSQAAEAVLQDPARFPQILKALQQDEVQAWTLNFSQKRRLLMNRDPKIRDLARAILDEKPESARPSSSGTRLRSVPTVIALGVREYFRKSARNVTSWMASGQRWVLTLEQFGIDPASVLLSDILIPSKSIAQNYEAYVVEKVSGGMSEGVIGSQTPTSLTLRQEEGKEIVIPRSDIKRMYASNLSAMPADLDRQISIQQMADLLSFIIASDK